jgi:hypothetical protein
MDACVLHLRTVTSEWLPHYMTREFMGDQFTDEMWADY